MSVTDRAGEDPRRNATWLHGWCPGCCPLDGRPGLPVRAAGPTAVAAVCTAALAAKGVRALFGLVLPALILLWTPATRRFFRGAVTVVPAVSH